MEPETTKDPESVVREIKQFFFDDLAMNLGTSLLKRYKDNTS